MLYIYAMHKRRVQWNPGMIRQDANNMKIKISLQQITVTDRSDDNLSKEHNTAGILSSEQKIAVY